MVLDLVIFPDQHLVDNDAIDSHVALFGVFLRAIRDIENIGSSRQIVDIGRLRLLAISRFGIC